MKKTIFLLFFLISPYFLWATTVKGLELSTGWENIGLSPKSTWRPYYGIQHTQGSRKAITFSLALHTLRNTKVFFSSFLALEYNATWSMIGAMNTLEGDFGLLGLGVYLTKPMSAYDPGDLKGKSFVVLDMNFANITFGGNLTPSKGVRSGGVREWTDPNKQYGNQYYAFGRTYAYFKYSIPVSLYFWKMVSNRLGIGMSLGADVFTIEKSLNIRRSPNAFGYNVRAGLFFVFL